MESEEVKTEAYLLIFCADLDCQRLTPRKRTTASRGRDCTRSPREISARWSGAAPRWRPSDDWWTAAWSQSGCTTRRQRCTAWRPATEESSRFLQEHTQSRNAYGFNMRCFQAHYTRVYVHLAGGRASHPCEYLPRLPHWSDDRLYMYCTILYRSIISPNVIQSRQ